MESPQILGHAAVACLKMPNQNQPTQPSAM